ncbi:MAG: site-2 protease family protein, partial [Cyanobacteria bacterium P01_E01_bin.48]
MRRAESTSDSRLLQFAVTPRRAEPGDDPRIGVSLAPNRNVEYRPADNWREVLSSAGTAYQRVVELNLRGFARLIGNFSDTAGQISGPVGIVKMGADLAESDASSLFNFTALISINLAILNILP